MNTQINVSQKEFQKNVKAYVNCFQQGVDVFVHCNDTSFTFTLSPVEDEDYEELSRLIEQGKEDYKNGKTIPASDFFKKLSDATYV
jgi:hypothetical protein